MFLATALYGEINLLLPLPFNFPTEEMGSEQVVGLVPERVVGLEGTGQKGK